MQLTRQIGQAWVKVHKAVIRLQAVATQVSNAPTNQTADLYQHLQRPVPAVLILPGFKLTWQGGTVP